MYFISIVFHYLPHILLPGAKKSALMYNNYRDQFSVNC